MTTGPADLYRFPALLLPWPVKGLKTLATYGLNGASAWHDGDTFNCMWDAGAGGARFMHIRCAGYNAPELKTGQPGADATTYARSLVEAGQIVYLDSIEFQASNEQDDFGRLLAYVTLPDGRDLTPLMLANTESVPEE